MREQFSPTESHPITRRGYLILRAMAETGASYAMASKAVAAVGREHPDWNLDEKAVWSEWQALDG